MSKSKKSYTKKKGGKNNYKRDKRDNDEIVISKENDPLWYNSNSQLTFDAGSYSFNTGLGTAFKIGNKFESIPGVCAIGILPVPVVENNANDPVNVTARALFSNVLRANSRANPDYEAADLMIYLMALAHAYSMLYWARRIYGLCNTYSQYNRYIPKAVLLADGVDYEDFLTQMAEFRYYINAYATQLATYCVPNDIPYFKRMCWLFSNVYMDEPTNRASYYIYHPETFCMWTDTGTNGSALKFINWKVTSHADGTDVYGEFGDTRTLTTLADVKKGFNIIIQQLHDSTDVNNISGDLLKAYGSENMIVPDTIPEDYAVIPEYVPEVLSQIHNAVLVGGVLESDSASAVEQDESTLNLYTNVAFVPYGYGWSGSENATQRNSWTRKYDGRFMLDIIKDNPTSDDVLVATRLMPALQVGDVDVGGGNTITAIRALHGGMDIATNMYIVKFGVTGDHTGGIANCISMGEYNVYGPYSTYMFVTGMTGHLDSANNYTYYMQMTSALNMLNLVGVFEQHPYLWISLGYTGGIDINLPYGDIDNYITLEEEELLRIHQAAMFSLFNVPGIALR